MKNFQQTPKQRRVDMAKQKQRIQASKPLIQFEQKTIYSDYGWGSSVKNIVHYINGKR